MLTVVSISVSARPRLIRHSANTRCRNAGLFSCIHSEVITNNSSLFTVWLCSRAASSAPPKSASEKPGVSGCSDALGAAVWYPGPPPGAAPRGRCLTSWFVCFNRCIVCWSGRSSCPILADTGRFVKWAGRRPLCFLSIFFVLFVQTFYSNFGVSVLILRFSLQKAPRYCNRNLTFILHPGCNFFLLWQWMGPFFAHFAPKDRAQKDALAPPGTGG